MAEYYQFAHSVQGYNHIKANKVCQDASGECHFEDVSIIAVADGHGSDNYIRTDRGSKFAVSAALTAIKAYLKQCPAALKDKTRTLSLLKDALKNDLPKFRVLQAAYELGILEAIQRSNPISTDDRLKITTGLVSQYAMLENAAKNAIDYWQDSVDADILYRALNDADECRESRINSAESTARPAIPIKPQQNPAENLLKIESISQDSIRMGIRLQWKKQSEIES